MRRSLYWRAAWLAASLLLAGAVAAEDCCRLPVTWQTHADARIAAGRRDRRPHLRLERSLEAAARRFREHGICIEWHERAAVTLDGTVYVGGAKSPQLASLEWSFGSPEAPALLFVDRILDLRAAVPRQRRAVTPRPGAYFAVIGTSTRRNESQVIGNELLHILGLRDEELGVTEESDVHQVDARQWAFARRVCEQGRGVVIKQAMVRAKDACLESPNSTSQNCYAP